MSDYFPLLKAFLEKRFGIVLKEHQSVQIERKIAPLLEIYKCSNLPELLLQSNKNQKLLQDLVAQFTINETSFFRDIQVFNTLQSDILPSIVEQRSSIKSLEILSAASSSGQEAYSLAMLLHDAFPQLKDWRVSIQGVDVDINMVEKARSGWYSQLEVNRGLATRLLLKHFERDNRGYTAKAHLKNWVYFKQGNLFELEADPKMYSVICLRNVLIYFSDEDQAKIIKILYKKLRHKGILLLGASEIGRMVPTDCFARIQKGNVIWYQAIN